MFIDFTQTPTIAGAIVFPEWSYSDRPVNVAAEIIPIIGGVQYGNTLSIVGSVVEVQPSES